MKAKSNRSCWQPIKYTAKGKPFVTRYGIRYHLDNFIRVSGRDYHGIMGLSNTAGLAITLSPCGESAMVTLLT